MSKNKLLTLFKKIDSFGVGVKFTIDGGETYNTCIGSISTLLAMILVGSFAIFSTVNMMAYNNTVFNQNTVRNYFT